MKKVTFVLLAFSAMVGCGDGSDTDQVTLEEVQQREIERMKVEFRDPQLFNRFLLFCKANNFSSKYGECVALKFIIDERGSDEPMVIVYPDGSTSANPS